MKCKIVETGTDSFAAFFMLLDALAGFGLIVLGVLSGDFVPMIGGALLLANFLVLVNCDEYGVVEYTRIVECKPMVKK